MLLQTMQTTTRLMARGRHGDALACLQAAAEVPPRLYLQMARCQWQLGQHAEAIGCFEKAARCGIDDHRLVLPWLQALQSMGRLQEAARSMDDLARQRPLHPAELLLRVLLEFPRLQSDAAQQAMQQLRGCEPGFFEIRLLLASSDWLHERTPGALQRLHTELSAERPRVTVASLVRLLELNPSIEIRGLPVHVMHRAAQQIAWPGVVIEAGVFHGRSINLLAGLRPDLSIHGFDSFQGLPTRWSSQEDAGAYSTGGKMPQVADNVRLHPGWFKDTLPPFAAQLDAPVALLHIDCDVYQSTREVLDALAHWLVPGTLVLFDELMGYPGHERHELLAWNEFLNRRGLACEYLCCTPFAREVLTRIVAPG